MSLQERISFLLATTSSRTSLINQKDHDDACMQGVRNFFRLAREAAGIAPKTTVFVTMTTTTDHAVAA